MSDGEKLCVILTLESIYDEVNSRTYYQGESLKRKDVDYVSIQTCSDDYDALRTYVETAINNAVGFILKKVKAFDWEIAEDVDGKECITFTFIPFHRYPVAHAERVTKLLGKSLFDYIVNHTIFEWYSTVKTELSADVGSRESLLLSEVLKHIGMVGGRIRRRATDLAGI